MPPVIDGTLALEEWDGLQLELLRAYRGPPTNWSGHFSSTSVVVWRINRGSASGRNDLGPFRAGPGQWLLHLPRRRFQAFAPETEIDSLQLRLSWSSGARALAGPSPLCLDEGQLPGLRKTFDSLLAFGADENSRRTLTRLDALPWDKALQFRCAFIQWTRTMLQGALRRGWRLALERHMDPRVRQLTELLEAHPLNQPLTRTDLGASASVGEARLVQLFRHQYGMTPRQFHEERRADYARASLHSGRKRVKEVAASLGFPNLQRFSAWFKQQTGISPRAYLKTARR